MYKLFSILVLIFLLFGCDDIEDGIIDPYDNEFSVVEIEAPSNLKYLGEDTALNTSITFTDAKSLLAVWIKVASIDGSFTVTYHNDMIKSGENKYSASVKMDTAMPSLTYTIDYYFSTEIQAEKKIASCNFTYDNMQNNVIPVISNPLFYYIDEEPHLRDTLENNREFILSIQVEDGNGLNDIDSVYTDFYSPNNPSAIRVLLFDDGVDEHGDAVAGDGVYSLKNIFEDAYGDRKFEFWARDRAGALSNMITHNVVVK